ncbi:hypothetical protein PR048_010218 [Dryococelus australis]|uniref:Uncharacterized protein n=1 Tax=Dryococelus australis TaxID=614101 RepID=A0ABQ9I379_9NEOP|nr:hypothetical protein PR048_010218 [Dryococelus australis]
MQFMSMYLSHLLRKSYMSMQPQIQRGTTSMCWMVDHFFTDYHGNKASSYADFTCKKYGRVSVVLDGYSASKPSIKDSEYCRCGVNTKQAPTVNFIPTVFIRKKD